jgi:hypothetical protein
MGEKVTFNEITKIIEITEAPVDGEILIDVKTDLYSDGKEDWVSNENLRKFQFPITAVGGNPLPGEKALGTTFFLSSDWKIRPYNASHRLTVNGNLYSEDGSDAFLDPLGSYTVRIMQQVSSLVDSTVQQLSEIEHASFNGGVTVDFTSPYSYATPPTDGSIIGTSRSPFNNFTDALVEANSRGFTTFYIIGDATIDGSDNYDGFIFIGESQSKSALTIEATASVIGCEFYDAHVAGVLDGNCKVKGCIIDNLSYIYGIVEQCLIESGDIVLGGSNMAQFLDCWSGSASQVNIPYIDMAGTGQDLILRNYNGAIGIKNLTGTDLVSIDLNSGLVVLDNTITNGTIVVRGIGQVIDNTTGSAIVDTNYLINPDVITTKVWDTPTANHTTPNTIGGDYNNMLETFPKLMGLMQNNYVLDNQTYQDYNGAKLLTSARIRTYTDNTLNTILATYQVTATWSNGQCTSYQVVSV